MARRLRPLVCCWLLLVLAAPAAGQSYPDRTVRVIVPTAPGGSIDVTARVLAAKLSAIRYWSRTTAPPP